MIATVVGNYPKIGVDAQSPNLRSAISRFDSGQITEEELHRIEDEVTKGVIEEQLEAGLDMITDGQIRWEDGQTYFAGKIQGFRITGLIRYFDTNTYYRQPIAEERLQWQGPISLRDYRFAASISSKPVKAVITGPYTLAKLSKGPFYNDFKSLVMSLADILNQEAKALAQAGASVIQFDEPAILNNKGDFPLFQEAMNVLIRGVSSKTALYTYFGDISDLHPGFFELPVHILGLDFVVGTRNWAFLKDFPTDKELGLGIIDARNTKLETVEKIIEAIERASKHVSLNRLHINPSCGLEFLPRSNAYSKLVRMVEAAARAKELLS
ncbi:MAG: methylcobamide--CoM methyltransferase [Chloroflexi bacterium]|nr:methylcobamide--CoM methyltransferase [Chloroflexota bacterium]